MASERKASGQREQVLHKTMERQSMLNAATLLHTAGRIQGPDRHFYCDGASLSFLQAAESSRLLALRMISLRIQPGDRVALFCPNSIEFVLLYFAILHLGGVVVPLNVMLKRTQITRCLQDCSPKAIICAGFDPGSAQLQELWEGFRIAGNVALFARLTGTPPDVSLLVEHVESTEFEGSSVLSFHMHPTSSEDVSCIIYTSGTTGQPKGVELTHGNLVAMAYAFSRHMLLGPEDRVLAGLPLFSSFGQTATLCATLLAGGDLVILPRFTGPGCLAALHRHRITFFGGVPTMIHGVLNAEESEGMRDETLKQHWRLAFAGGAPVPTPLLEAFRERFQIPIIHGYGLTETSAVDAFNPPLGKHKDASIGLPFWGVEMQVVDGNMQQVPPGQRGELVIRGPHVMRGYHNNDEANREAFRGGWLHTGDIATEDDEGYFYIVGRLKEMILRGGQNVYPHDVEEVLTAHPFIDMAAVLGIPDERLGEEIAAFVILKKGASASTEELILWCKERLPAFAYPRFLQIRESLPIGPTGKILKKEIVLSQGK